MTPFTVDWSDDALDELAALWLAWTGDPRAANRALADIDAKLARGPQHNGEELSEGLWALTALPFRAFYTIDSGRQWVEVTAIRLASDRP